MGEEGKHSRFSLRSGSHRALGVAFGRSGLGVEEGDPIDAAVRLEVNRWKGSVEPRVVLRELYPHPGQTDPDRKSAEWWQRFEAELQVDPRRMVAARDRARRWPGAGRVDARSTPAAAMVAELASSGGGAVLAAVADTERRAPLAREGVRLADVFTLEAEPELAREFEHVVLVDPPACERVARLLRAPRSRSGLSPPRLGESEREFCLSVLDRTWPPPA